MWSVKSIFEAPGSAECRPWTSSPWSIAQREMDYIEYNWTLIPTLYRSVGWHVT